MGVLIHGCCMIESAERVPNSASFVATANIMQAEDCDVPQTVFLRGWESAVNEIAFPMVDSLYDFCGKLFYDDEKWNIELIRLIMEEDHLPLPPFVSGVGNIDNLGVDKFQCLKSSVYAMGKMRDIKLNCSFSPKQNEKFFSKLRLGNTVEFGGFLAHVEGDVFHLQKSVFSYVSINKSINKGSSPRKYWKTIVDRPEQVSEMQNDMTVSGSIEEEIKSQSEDIKEESNNRLTRSENIEEDSKKRKRGMNKNN
jgi:hypothetical protein